MDDVVGVHLEDDFYTGGGYWECDDKPDHLGNRNRWHSTRSHVDIPRAQLERWRAIQAAYEAMQAEIIEMYHKKQELWRG